MTEFTSQQSIVAFTELPISPELFWIVSTALLHTIWQGLLLACLVALLVKIRLPRSVHQRFAICFASLIAISLAPFANAYWIGKTSHRPEPILAATQEFKIHGRLPLFAIQDLAIQNQGNENPDAATEITEQKLARGSGAETIAPTSGALIPRSASELPSAQRQWAHWSILLSVFATIAYLVGVTLMMLRLAFGLGRQRHFSQSAKAILDLAKVPDSIVATAERAAGKLGRQLQVSLAMFNGRGSAMATGIFRPIILLNASLASGLTPIQLEQILAHELVHIYRWDPLTQLIQRLIESLLFFHPGVWYISRQVSDLREMCCDDRVARSYSNVDYAMALLECAELEQLAIERPGSGLTLSAVGNRPSQLATRIQMLLAYENRGRTTEKSASHASAMAMMAVALLVVAAGFFLFNRSGHNSNQASHPPALSIGSTSTVQFDDAEWEWVIPKKSQLDSTSFLFGGAELTLTDEIPDDVQVISMVNSEKFKFGQWHFGDTFSTRVAVLAETEGSEIRRLFVDLNRDRKIDDEEEITTRAANDKTWLVNLDAEVRDNKATIHAKRQIGITPKLKSGKIRVTTTGYCQGKVNLDGKEVSIRRIDQDGNGLPTDAVDQVWFDLDLDGEFDLISERKKVSSFLNLNGTRYSLFSDRLGQSLKVAEANDVGKVKFVFTADEQDAKVQRLEGCLRDESGMVIAIGQSTEVTTIPAGKYSIENLLLEVRAKDNSIWRVTLARGINTGFFEVEADSEQEIKLLESLKFSLTAEQHENMHSSHLTQLRPYLYTPNGLVVSNFVCENRNSEFLPPNSSIVARFKIGGTVDQDNRPMESSSCYG